MVDIKDILERKIMNNFTGEFNSFDDIQKCIDELIINRQKKTVIKIRNKLDKIEDFNREPGRADYSEVMEVINSFL